ncbi:MAG: hypothetical protein PHY54_17265 [Methylococcales bacterium]|nr:hypothetical protein [Methylococcales bacterium]
MCRATKKLSPGLRGYFFDSLFAEIDSLALYGKFHRLLAKRFPYAIYYKVIDSKAIVFRVLDCRRNPNKLRKVFEEMG